MHLLRFLALIFFVTLPLFSIAQTTTTTDPAAEIQSGIDALIAERIANTPTAEDIRAGAIQDLLNITAIPKTPAAHETVNVTVESYLSDLSKATIAWSKNGTTMLRGIGKTRFSFENGGSGEMTRIGITITTNDGVTIARTLSFRPAGVTLLWEASTYTPPFYKGKPLMAPQARVRAVAVSDTSTLNPSTLSYVWKKDGDVVSGASGYGKSSFSFAGPKPYGKANVSVEVSSLSDTLRSEVRLKEIPLARPFILFYENHPLLGVWLNAPLANDITLAKKEFSVTAAPYFFSLDTAPTPTFSYDWSLNGRAVNNPDTTITLRNDQGSKGDSLLSLGIQGLRETFQSGDRSLLIHFTAGETARATF